MKRKMGENEKALEYYNKSLEIKIKVHDQDHPLVASTKNKYLLWFWIDFGQDISLLIGVFLCSMAVVYKNQGKYPEALRMHEDVLEFRLKTFGPEHLDVAKTQNNIAIIFRQQGKYPEALEMYQKSLATKEKVLSPENLDVAATYGNLGNMYRSQGKYLQALQMHQRCLKVKEKILGPEHPDVAKTKVKIATVLRLNYCQNTAIESAFLAPG